MLNRALYTRLTVKDSGNKYQLAYVPAANRANDSMGAFLDASRRIDSGAVDPGRRQTYFLGARPALWRRATTFSLSAPPPAAFRSGSPPSPYPYAGPSTASRITRMLSKPAIMVKVIASSWNFPSLPCKSR